MNYDIFALTQARKADSLDKQKIANVAIVEAPIEPRVPSKPNKLLNFSLGGILACFLSLGLAFASEYWLSTVTDLTELARAIRIPRREARG